MELVFEYWAQIALILTIIVGGIKFFLDASVRKSEIRISTATKLRFDLAKEYVLAYTDLYQKLSAVSSHLMFGSWEDEKLVPVLESYNSSYSQYNSLSQLIKFSFNTKIGSQIEGLNLLLRDATNKISLYLDQRKSKGDIDPDVYRKIGKEYADAVSKIIPEEIPRLGDNVLQSMSKELKLG